MKNPGHMEKIRAAWIALAFSLAACGGGGGSSSTDTASDSTDARSIGGAAVKGPFHASAISLYAHDSAGNKSSPTPLASTTTDSQGNFSASLPSNSQTALIGVSGGGFYDESDPAGQRFINWPTSQEMLGFLPAGQSTAAITPLSDSLVRKSRRDAMTGLDFIHAVNENRRLAGIALDFDPVGIIPPNPTNPPPGASEDQLQYAMFLGGIAQAVNTVALRLGLTAPNIDVLIAVLKDLQDCVLDGREFNQVLMVNGQALPSDVDLNHEIERFRNNHFNFYSATPLLVINSQVCANRLPRALNDEVNPGSGTSVNVAVLANDSDPDGSLNPSTIEFISQPAHGQLAVNATTGVVTYTRSGPAFVSDSFSYRVSDNLGARTNVANVGIVVLNSLPVANNDSATTNEDTAITVDVLANDTDADGTIDRPTLQIVSGPANGIAIKTGTNLVQYTPSPNFNGSDSVRYQVRDNAGGLSNVATLSITVNPVNDPPVASPDSLTVAEGGTSTVLTGGATSVLANDSDIDGPSLSAILVSPPAHSASLTLNPNGTFSYTHDGSETTSDSFSYKASDGLADSNTVTVSITVTPVNDPPVANNDTANVLQGGTTSTVNGSANSVLTNDTDPEGSLLNASLVSAPSHASSFTLNTDGTFSYMHDGSATTSDSFSYRASDGALLSGVATVSINITPVAPNTAPFELTNQPFFIRNGADNSLESGNLEYADNEQGASQITFSFDLTGKSSDCGAFLPFPFTQENVNNSTVKFSNTGCASDSHRADILLSDPSFESAVNPVPGLPTVFGVWGGDQASSQAANGLSPVHGERFLHFDATTPSGSSTETRSEIMQLVDLSAILAAHPGRDLEIEALGVFIRTGGSSGVTDTEFSMSLRFYSGLPGAFPGSYESAELGTVTQTEILSALETDETRYTSVSGMIPNGATYMALVLEAHENVTNDSGGDQEFEGHAVDALDLRYRIVGETVDMVASDGSLDEPFSLTLISEYREAVGFDPIQNENTADPLEDLLIITTAGSFDSGSLNLSTVVPHGQWRGRIPGTHSSVSSDITFSPAPAWLPGELVTVSVTKEPASPEMPPEKLRPVVYQFRAAVTGSGDGTLQERGSMESPLLNNATSIIDAGHFDPDVDAFLDLVTVEPSAGFTVWRNTSGTAEFSPGNATTYSGSFIAMAIGDVNADGFPDVVAIDQPSTEQTLKVYLNSGVNGALNAPGTLDTGEDDIKTLRLADIDADGDLDVVLGRVGNSRLYTVHLNDGSGGFSSGGPDFILDSGTGSTTFDMELADINNDGDLDLLLASQGSKNGIEILLNKGDGSYVTHPLQGLISSQVSRFEVTDMNNDGYTDIVVAPRGTSQQGEVYLNNGAGVFPNMQVFGIAELATDIKLGDMNSDGHQDAVISYGGADDEYVYINNGSGGLSLWQSGINTNNAAVSLVLGDFDADDDLDVIFGNFSSKITPMPPPPGDTSYFNCACF